MVTELLNSVNTLTTYSQDIFNLGKTLQSQISSMLLSFTENGEVSTSSTNDESIVIKDVENDSGYGTLIKTSEEEKNPIPSKETLQQF